MRDPKLVPQRVGDIVIEVISDSGEETPRREVLLAVDDRRYRVSVELDRPPPGERGPYGATTPGPRVQARSEFRWSDATPEQRTAFNAENGRGIVVEMPTGVRFSRVEEPGFAKFGSSWRDEETGRVWSSEVPDLVTMEEALSYCLSRGAALPSAEMLEELAEHLGAETRGSRSAPQLHPLLPGLETVNSASAASDARLGRTYRLICVGR